MASASAVGGVAAAGSGANDGVATVADERRAETLSVERRAVRHDVSPSAAGAFVCCASGIGLNELSMPSASSAATHSSVSISVSAASTSLCGLWSAPRSIRKANLPGRAPFVLRIFAVTRLVVPRFVALVSSS